jgi:integrase
VAGWIEDRWLTKRKNPETGRRERTELYGKCKRYRVAGIPGVRKRSFETLEEAKTWKSTAITDTKRHEFIDARDGEVLLGDYITVEWWPKRTDPVGTAHPMKSKVFTHIVGTELGRTPMGSIRDDHLLSWRAELKARSLADSTIEVIWNHLSSVFQSAVGKRIARNPCRTAGGDVRPPSPGETKARAWTVGEAHAIREGLPKRYRIIADLGMQAGQRQGEAFAFSPDDVDRDRMVIHLRRQLLWENSTRPYFKLPKGKKERDIPLSPGLLKRIDAHELEHPPVTVTLPWKGTGNGGRPTAMVRLLTTTAFGNRLNPSTYNARAMKPALAAAGLIAPRDEDQSWGWEASRDMMHHRWRHTYASVQLAAGEDPVSLSHWMGHASPSITLQIYTHFMPDNGRRGRSAVDAWLAVGPAAAPAPADLGTVEPLGWTEAAPFALSENPPAELFLQGARFGGAWAVGAALERDGVLVGEIRTGPGDDPDRALASGLAWLRECCDLEGLAVAGAENLNAEFPDEARPYQTLGRFQIVPAKGVT